MDAIIDHWNSSVARSDMADWVTVGAYLVASWLALRASRHSVARKRADEWWFWRFTMVLLVFLGINELLDLQSLLTVVGRDIARADGWYDRKREIQYFFVFALAAVAILFGLALLWLTRRMHGTVRLALAGLVFIGLFVLFRAASFHHMDDLLTRGAEVFNWGSIQELLGIAVLVASAMLYARAPVAKTKRRRSKART